MSRRELQSLDTEIPLRPITWARAAGNGRRYNPTRYRDWKTAAVQWVALAARGGQITGEVSVVIDLYPDRVRVAVAQLEDRRRPGTGITGDVDNYAKAVLDTLQAVEVLSDDVQVSELHIRIRKP